MVELKSQVDGHAVVTPMGNLDSIGATALRHLVDDLLCLRMGFVIDLRRTNRIDATGMSALLGTIRRAQALSVDVSIMNPRPSIERQLGLVGLHALSMFSSSDNGNDAA
jgi:anti-sigma B factor antagonist